MVTSSGTAKFAQAQKRKERYRVHEQVNEKEREKHRESGREIEW